MKNVPCGFIFIDESRPDMDEVSMLTAITLFLLSASSELVGVIVLQKGCMDRFRNALNSSDPWVSNEKHINYVLHFVTVQTQIWAFKGVINKNKNLESREDVLKSAFEIFESWNTVLLPNLVLNFSITSFLTCFLCSMERLVVCMFLTKYLTLYRTAVFRLNYTQVDSIYLILDFWRNLVPLY